MTTIFTTCVNCGNRQTRDVEEMLLGYFCMHRFGYPGPDLMCNECGMDHFNHNVSIRWDDE